MKERLQRRDQDIGVLQSKVTNLELQIESLKRERDRLLDVSSTLKISNNKL